MKGIFRCVAICASCMLALASFGKGAAKASGKASPSNEVLVRVNGVDITRGQLNRQIDMMAELLKNKRATPLTDKMVAKFKQKSLKPMSDALYRRLVVETCLAASNLTVSAAARLEVENEAKENFCRKGQTLEDVRKLMVDSGYGKEFDSMIDYDALLRTFVTTVHSNEYFVTDAKIQEVRREVEEYNNRANETNKVTLAEAVKIRDRARSGEDFGKLADEYSMDGEKERGGAVGDCEESDFVDEPHVWNAVQGKKPGFVSDVLEIEDGYAIYKVLRVNTAEESETGSPSVSLARIFFRRAYLFPPQDDDEFRQDIETETRTELLNQIYKDFRAQSEVVYPNGPVRVKK